MSLVLLIARLVLAGVFTVAGLAKLADQKGSRDAIAGFGIPQRFAPALAVLLPLVELGTALALVPVGTAWLGGVAALALLAVFLIGIAYSLARGRRPDCNCFGQLHSKPVGRSTLIRNAALAALAAVLVWQGPKRVGPSLVAWVGAKTGADAAIAALVLVALGAILAQSWFLSRLFAQHDRLLVRLDDVEARLAQGLAKGRAATGMAQAVPTMRAPQGLAIGVLAPAFVLPDLAGRRTSLAELLSSGRPALLLFMDAHCGPCGALLPDVARWHREYPDRFTVATLSRGSPEENRKKFLGIDESTVADRPTVLLQQEYEVAQLYSAPGTPSGVLVTTTGRIGSAVAAGADAIRTLVAESLESDPPADLDRATAAHHRQTSKENGPD